MPAVFYNDPILYNDPDTFYSGEQTAVVTPVVLPPGSDRIQILAYDLSAERITGEVKYTSFSWTEAISSPGSFDCTIVAGTGSTELCDPGRTCLYVLVGSQIVWGGIVWQRAWTGGNSISIRVGGAGWWSYYRDGRRTIRSTKTYTAQEQFAVVADLLTYTHGVSAQANPLDVTLRPNPAVTTTTVTRTYEATERKPVGEAIEELGQANAGFEFLPVTEWDSTTIPPKPKHYLDVWSPRLGRVTPIVWTHGGDITVTTFDSDGSKLATHIDAIGSGTGAAKHIQVADITNAYPLLERQITFTDSNVNAFLTRQADAELARTAEPPTTLTVTLRRTEKWPLGSWITGDEVWISAHDTDLNIEDYYRIQGYRGAVGPTGELDVQIDLALGAALGRPLTSPARKLPSETRELRRRLERLERQ